MHIYIVDEDSLAIFISIVTIFRNQELPFFSFFAIQHYLGELDIYSFFLVLHEKYIDVGYMLVSDNPLVKQLSVINKFYNKI